MVEREHRRQIERDDEATSSSGVLGATEDDVERSEAIVAPGVTDKGRDERGRDQPDSAEFGRGTMPDNPAMNDLSEPESERDAPHYGRSPRQGLGGARLQADEAHEHESGQDELDDDAAEARRLTSSGTLRTEEVVGQGTRDAFGERGDKGGGMLNTEVPAGMAGAGPLGGSPARGDTADAAAHRRKHGIAGPSAAGARGIHLGVGHNSPTGESTPGMHTAPEMVDDVEGDQPRHARRDDQSEDQHQEDRQG